MCLCRSNCSSLCLWGQSGIGEVFAEGIDALLPREGALSLDFDVAFAADQSGVSVGVPVHRVETVEYRTEARGGQRFSAD
jgi:hypothetical protein